MNAERFGAPPPAPPALELRSVRCGYGRIEVLRGLTLTVPAGTVFAILGRNCAGKTTLLKVSSGRLPVTEGCVHLSGVHVNGVDPLHLVRMGVCTIPAGRGVFPNLTVRENLRLVTYSGLSAADIEERAFGRFPMLAGHRTRVAGSLSGGEQQMLALARAVATDPALLLLDEVSTGLAPMVVTAVFELVRAIAAEGTSVVLVEQFARSALAVSDYAAVMHKGRIVAVGEPADVGSALSGAYLGGPG